ncbi:hypothetical protein EKK58_07535 [Candidatus Dependentiae bacterium]|nr:MAG: hypothetical protein EKK58_07535 [Candidatus Dependentiae bacterium]
MSKIVSLHEVIKQASTDLKYDHEFLQRIALHQFSYIKEFQKNPTSARLHLSKFGMFVIPRWKFYETLISKVIPACRLDRSQQMFDILNKFLKLRFTINAYYRYQEYKKRTQDGLYERTTTKVGNINDDWDISGEGSDDNDVVSSSREI